MKISTKRFDIQISEPFAAFANRSTLAGQLLPAVIEAALDFIYTLPEDVGESEGLDWKNDAELLEMFVREDAEDLAAYIAAQIRKRG